MKRGAGEDGEMKAEPVADEAADANAIEVGQWTSYIVRCPEGSFASFNLWLHEILITYE